MNSSIEVEENTDRSSYQNALKVIQTGFNLLNHIIISLVAVYMTFVCYHAGNQPVSWHAWLCTIGYQLLMTQSIMAFYAHNVWSKQQPRQTQKTFHWILQAVGSTAAIAGIIVEYVGRIYLNKKTHFSSTHSIIGLIAGIFTLLGMFNGVSALWSVELRKYARPVYFKLAHNFNGIVAFVLGMVALYYGYDKGFMERNSRGDFRMCLQAIAIISIVLTLIGALRSLFNLFRVAFIN